MADVLREAVCVLGNLTTDLVLHGVGELPSWGRETRATGHVERPAGQGAGVALGLARLGIETRMVGVVGGDAPGRAIADALESAGIDLRGLETHASDSTAMTIGLVRPDGERAFVSDFACQRRVDEDFVERHWELVATSRALCLVGLFNLPTLTREHATRLFVIARAARVVTILDTGWDPAGWVPGTASAMGALLEQTDVFLPNLDEARAITGFDDAERAADALVGLGVGLAVVKCGASGSIARWRGESEVVAAVPVEVHDAVGAGDCFDAAFVHAFLRGRQVREACEFASASAALYVSRRDERWPTVGEIDALLESTRGSA
jgi:ribokinase